MVRIACVPEVPMPALHANMYSSELCRSHHEWFLLPFVHDIETYPGLLYDTY